MRARAALAVWMCLVPLLSCAPDFDPAGNANGSGDAPVVLLGADQTVEPGSWVRLDGSTSYDPAGRELNYLWTQTGGPDVELQAWRTPIASFTAPPSELPEPLVFRLEISNEDAAAGATTKVRVVQSDPPEEESHGDVRADAGADQGVQAGVWVTLDGSDSTGEGDETLEFQWSQIGGSPVALQDADQAVARFEAPHVEQGLVTLIFQLLATTGTHSDTDTVNVVVVATGGGEGECDSAPECDDADSCTLDFCVDGFCQHGPDPACQDPACNDGMDNDDDGLIDYPADPGCDDSEDDNEYNNGEPPACSDEIDNDDDGLIDYPADPGCENSDDEDEYEEPEPPACSDGIDNDGDGLTDYPADPGCHNANDDSEYTDNNSQQLFTKMWGSDSEEVRARYPEWGLQRSRTFSAWCFDRNNDGYWDERERGHTDECLDKVAEDYDGYLEIDWEGRVTDVFKAGPTDPQFEDVVSEMLELLGYLQQQRPLTKFGYFGLPKRKSWHPEWEESMYAAREIFDASDVLFPEVYDFSKCSEDPDDNNYECASDHYHRGQDVLFALELAEGKPVLVYTWHRYHSHGDRSYAFKVIPHDEYVNHLRYMMNLEYEGRRPLGVVIWGATRWYYEEGFATDENGDYVNTGWRWDLIRSRYLEEMLPGETIEEYILRLHPKIYDNAAEAVYGP